MADVVTRRRSLRWKRSSALVVTLAIIALLTITIVTFISFSKVYMQVEESRTNRQEADLLVESGGAYATTIFLQEIAANSTHSTGSAGSITNYYPNSPTNMVPARLLSSAISASNPNFYNLIRQSVPATDPNASADNTDLAAANGRTITLDRWNAPALLGGTGIGSTQLPNWIYVDRIQGPVNPATTNVIGRFAYNVYDIGGLLNANAAGFPSSGVLSAQQASSIKGTPAGADLTQIPGITTTDIANFIAFRNASTSGNATNYISQAQGATRAGFLSSVFTNTAPVYESGYTNNYFSNRQDLIRYAETENPDFTNALPYLTTFSRTVTSPSWIPQTPAGSTTNYATLAMSSGSTNRAVLEVRAPIAGVTLTHYNDDGSTGTYTLAAGTPLLQRRFSLAKLAWLTDQGPSASISQSDPEYNPAGTAAAIKACFGLTWSANIKDTTTGESWTYQDATVNTLDQVAALNPPREPNFFELLKAGILNNSVGCYSLNGTFESTNVGQSTLTNKQKLEANADLQIARIGADIIDSAKPDNIPTTIWMNGRPVHGAEDLPYLYGILNTVLLKTKPVTPATTPPTANLVNGFCSLIFVPLLFNPNASPVTPAVKTPTNFQVAIESGGPATLSSIYLAGYSPAVGSPLYRAPGTDLSRTTSPITFTFNSQSADPFRNGIMPINAAFVDVTSANTSIYPTLVPNADSSLSNLQAFLIYDYSKATPPVATNGSDTFNNSTIGCFRINLSNTIIELQYISPFTQLPRVYDTLMGNEADLTTGINKFVDSYPGAPFAAEVSGTFTRTTIDVPSYLSSAILKVDPRTTRYGPSFDTAFSTTSPVPLFSASQTQGMQASLPFGNGNVPTAGITYPISMTSPVGVFPGLWPQGGTTSWVSTSSCNNVADVDGVVRPADGWLNASGGTTAGPANLFSNVNSTTFGGRPRLLHRPFQSVAELGYVFRDTPWKSLNLFDPSSGDGGLLDLFSVVDEPVVSSGRISLNTRQPLVLQSLLSGAALNATATTPTLLPNPATIASSLVGSSSSYSVDQNGNALATVPINLSQLPNFIGSSNLTTAFPYSSSVIEYEREAVARALAGSGQTRTWNLLIDVVSQSGRFPEGSTSGSKFIVQGEKHYWFSVAIDRYTSRIVDEQIETVDN